MVSCWRRGCRCEGARGTVGRLQIIWAGADAGAMRGGGSRVNSGSGATVGSAVSRALASTCAKARVRAPRRAGYPVEP